MTTTSVTQKAGIVRVSSQMAYTTLGTAKKPSTIAKFGSLEIDTLMKSPKMTTDQSMRLNTPKTKPTAVSMLNHAKSTTKVNNLQLAT